MLRLSYEDKDQCCVPVHIVLMGLKIRVSTPVVLGGWTDAKGKVGLLLSLSDSSPFVWTFIFIAIHSKTLCHFNYKQAQYFMHFMSSQYIDLKNKIQSTLACWIISCQLFINIGRQWSIARALRWAKSLRVLQKFPLLHWLDISLFVSSALIDLT